MISSLVDYSSSDSEDCAENTESPRLKKNLPSFEPIDKISTSSLVPEENPSSHDGRIRTIKHERGNWASHVYISFPESESIEELQTELQNYCYSCHALDMKPFEDLHISLTRLLILKHHWINELTESIKQQTIITKPFGVQLNAIKLYCNDEQTRTFVGITVFDDDTPALSKLVKQYDQCLLSYNLPKYYDPPSFHISILWCLGDQRQQLAESIDKFNRILQKYLEDDFNDFQMMVKNIFFKCGNRTYSFGCVS